MDFSVLLFVLGILLILFIIFKLIKKIIVAVIFCFIFLILIVGVVFGVIFLDIKSITDSQRIDVELLLTDSDENLFSILIPIEDGVVNYENVSSVEVLDKENRTNFYSIYFPKEVFEDVLLRGETYYLPGTENKSVLGVEVDFGLEKEEVLSIIESKDALGEYVVIISKKNNVSGFEDIARGIIEEEFEKNMSLGFKGALFLATLEKEFLDVNGKSHLTIFSAYRRGEIVIEPERLTFKLVKFLPLEYVETRMSEALLS